MSMRISAAILLCLALPAAWAQTATVYRCPGNGKPDLYTSEITERQAKERGCRTIENAPITVVSPPRRAPQPGTPPASGVARGDAKVDAKEQQARDSDARAILESEIRREEEALATLQKDFNNGEPERLGSERNYVRYQERVEEMRNAIARKQADLSALRRELGKLTASPASTQK